MKNNFFDFLESRGFVHQSTDKESIKKLLRDEICIGYIVNIPGIYTMLLQENKETQHIISTVLAL